MKVQVAKWGNSTAVRLPKALVRQLGLVPGATLDATVSGKMLQLVAHPQPSSLVGGRPEPFPVTAEWLIAEAERLGGLDNAPEDDWDWGHDVGSEVIYDDYNPRPKTV